MGDTIGVWSCRISDCRKSIFMQIYANCSQYMQICEKCVFVHLWYQMLGHLLLISIWQTTPRSNGRHQQRSWNHKQHSYNISTFYSHLIQISLTLKIWQNIFEHTLRVFSGEMRMGRYTYPMITSKYTQCTLCPSIFSFLNPFRAFGIKICKGKVIF